MLNGGALVWALRQMSVTDYRIIVLGDDSVVALKTPVSGDTFSGHLARLGLVAKTKERADPDLVEFCSGRFWHASDGRVWGPKVGRTLAKVGFSVNRQANPRAWMKGVLVGMVQDCSHVPILNVYVDHCLGLLASERAQPRPDDHKFHVSRKHKPTQATYEQFYKVYDITAAMLDTLKADILRVKSLPHLLQSPVLEVLVEADM